MEVIPALDLRAGRCVRLYQGDYSKETVFSEDPPAMARHWRQLGAPRLHVVDLDGAATGRVENADVIQAIVRAVDVPIELGGGIRDLATVSQVLLWGVDRVVLGTTAVLQPELVEQACLEHPEAIVVGVDTRQGKVAIHGWLEETDVNAHHLVRRMTALGVPRFIYTDITRDGTVTEPNFEGIAELLRATDRPVIASGGVSHLEHLRQLNALGAEGAIVGRALYTGALDLPQALRATAAYQPPGGQASPIHE